MRDTFPLLKKIEFPSLKRKAVEILQVNLGYLCNQQCIHCHVNAGPNRKEIMAREHIDLLLQILERTGIGVLDLTGGAPELNPDFRYLVSAAKALDVHIIDRCNLTVLEEDGQENLADFLREQGVEIVASLPCYLKSNVDKQRGSGVFEKSIKALKRLNQLGYGKPGSGLVLNLMYNPQDPALPPEQIELEKTYKAHLMQEWGIVFNHLYTLANMPIQRFGSLLVSKNQFDDYMDLLKKNHHQSNLTKVMCRNMISIDWNGYVYDCDFNQMLGLALKTSANIKWHISDLDISQLDNHPIRTAGHCFACTAGAGSSCGGAL